MKKLFCIIIGALLIAVGVICALNIFGVMTIDISTDGWWTLFIILPALSGLVNNKDKLGSLVALAVGVYLLLAAQDVIEYEMFWELLIPTVIVLLGIKIIVKTLNPKSNISVITDKKDSKNVSAFGSKKIEYDEEIKHAKVGAVFGGTTCDLTDSDFDDESQIDVFCLFGGADIIVPEYVKININAFCMFGGISDKRRTSEDIAKTAQLTVNGFCLFGGADIKNSK